MRCFTKFLSSLCLASAIAGSASALGVGTAFTYQGLLKNGGAAVNESVDLKCRLYDANVDGNLIGTEILIPNVIVTDGVFTVDMDFGAQFGGTERWLEIEVKLSTDLPTAYEILSPRQEIKPAPFSLFSLTTGLIPDIALTGTYSQNLNLTNAANTFAGNGAGLSNLNAAALSSGTVSSSLNFTNAGNTYSGNGAGLTNLPWASLTGVPAGFADGTDNDSGSIWSLNGLEAVYTQGGVHIDATGHSGEFKITRPGSSLGTIHLGSPGGWPGFIIDAADGGNYSMKFQNTGVSLGAGASEVFWVGENDSVGIGTKTPNANWRMVIENGGAAQWKGSLAAGSSTGAKAVLGELNGIATVGAHNAALNAWQTLHINPTGGIIMAKDAGNIGIGTTAPASKLDVNGRMTIRSGADLWNPDGSGSNNSHIHLGGTGDWYIRSASTSGKIVIQDAGGNVGIGTDSPTEKLDVAGRIRIRGGADIVEGFDTSCGTTLEPGTVVVIDPTPGKTGSLMQSTEAYDFKVAGVVSGANGLSPGIHLGQESVMDGDTKVAMTGRVYVKCSTENGAIVPGDLLTTASLAGHAMKATDRSRSHGAVIGKAMSALDEQTGLVLVLVNLQ